MHNERGESKPDIDKILPICELFQITTEELLTGKELKREETKSEEKKESKETLDSNEKTKKRSILIATSIFLYFIGVIFIIMPEELNISSVSGISGFLLICAIATSLIVYQGIVYSKKKEEKIEEDSPRKKQLKMVTELVVIIFLVIYLIINFTTYAWHITWIIWVIYAAVDKIITLAFSLRSEENETLDINENKNNFCIGICNIPSTEIIISIPRTKEYEASFTTVSGDVYIGEVQLSLLNLKTTSGDIEVQSSKETVVATTSGDISLNKVKNLKLTTTSGDVELGKVIGSCQIKTTSGDVKIEVLKINKNSKITSVSGDIEIQRNENSYVKTETVSGEVSVENNNRYAKAELSIKTTSGDIEVENN